jgi:FkbM family methyltransferase
MLKDTRMKTPTEPRNFFLKSYSLANHLGLLRTAIGRRLFRSAYFWYKRYVEDDLEELLQAFPVLVCGGSALDIGANLGYTATVLARALAPGKKVYAFEPEPSNFSILQQTADRPEFEGKIVAMQCAVGAECGTIELWVNDDHHGDHRVITEQFRSQHPGLKKIGVDMVSVDSFLEDLREDVSFIKIDVQGYELAVCEGMRSTLERSPDTSVLLEFMPSAMRDLGFEPSHLIHFFAERGFGIYHVGRRGRLSQGMPAIMEDSGYVNLLFSRRPIAGGIGEDGDSRR